MSPELTANDLLILEQFRLERFRNAFLDSTTPCFLHLNVDNSLEIHCLEPWVVDELLDDIEGLGQAIWHMVGAYQVAIFFYQEEIFSIGTRPVSKRKQPA